MFTWLPCDHAVTTRNDIRRQNPNVRRMDIKHYCQADAGLGGCLVSRNMDWWVRHDEVLDGNGSVSYYIQALILCSSLCILIDRLLKEGPHCPISIRFFQSSEIRSPPRLYRGRCEITLLVPLLPLTSSHDSHRPSCPLDPLSTLWKSDTLLMYEARSVLLATSRFRSPQSRGTGKIGFTLIGGLEKGRLLEKH